MSEIVKKAKSQVKVFQSYKDVFLSPHGEVVLKDLMTKYSLLNSTFSGDVNEMLIREGERKVVLHILSVLKINITELNERIKEHARDE